MNIMFTERGTFHPLIPSLTSPSSYAMDCRVQDILISTIGSSCKLQILDVYPEDEGKYACTARNSAGETTTTCFVLVEGEFPPLNSPLSCFPSVLLFFYGTIFKQYVFWLFFLKFSKLMFVLLLLLLFFFVVFSLFSSRAYSFSLLSFAFHIQYMYVCKQKRLCLCV